MKKTKPVGLSDNIKIQIERNYENILWYDGVGEIHYTYEKELNDVVTLELRIFPATGKHVNTDKIPCPREEK